MIWVFLSEIFPNAVRAKGQTLGWFTHWAMAAAVTWLFPVALKNVPPAAIFSFFASVMALQLLFVWLAMPETKGGALEDIGKRLTGADSP